MITAEEIVVKEQEVIEKPQDWRYENHTFPAAILSYLRYPVEVLDMKKALAVVSFLVLLLAPNGFADVTNEDCKNADGCAECIQTKGCAWCSKVSKAEGTSTTEVYVRH